MKFILLTLLTLFSFISFSYAESAATKEPASNTQADWFSPSCPSCAKLLTPGSANLGNSKGVFRQGTKKKKITPTAPAGTGN